MSEEVSIGSYTTNHAFDRRPFREIRFEKDLNEGSLPPPHDPKSWYHGSLASSMTPFVPAYKCLSIGTPMDYHADAITGYSTNEAINMFIILYLPAGPMAH